MEVICIMLLIDLAPSGSYVTGPNVGNQRGRSLGTADRPPLPPFIADTAAQKVRMAEDAWNTSDPARVALAYTTDSRWRNRAEIIHIERKSKHF